MKLCLLCLALSMNFVANSQRLQLDTLKRDVAEMRVTLVIQNRQLAENERRIAFQESQINGQTSMLDTAFDGVSTEIGAASYFLGIVGAVVGVVGVFLTFLVTSIHRRVRRMTEDSEQLQLSNIETRNEILRLSETITKDPKRLYALLKKEESDHLIERLLEVPDDIGNLIYPLLSRNLDGSYFPKIKDAFLRADNHSKSHYHSLFFQHFAQLSILDLDLKPIYFDNLLDLINLSFTNDIIKSSRDYFTAFTTNSLKNAQVEINTFARAISESKFSTLGEVYVNIFNQFSRVDRFFLYQLVEKNEATKVFRTQYGALLLDYLHANPDEGETGILREIQLLIAEHE